MFHHHDVCVRERTDEKKLSCRPFHTAGGRIRFVNIQPGSMLTRWKMSWLFSFPLFAHVNMHRKLSKLVIHISGIVSIVLNTSKPIKMAERSLIGRNDPIACRESPTGQNNICTSFFSYLWSMETSARSSRCLLLNMLSLWGNSRRLGGPNGVQMANKARGGSSVLRFCPCNTFTRPLISSLCVFVKEKKFHHD